MDDYTLTEVIAVAKVVIFIFTDHIHDTYIKTGGWQVSTLNWIMGWLGRLGDTLMDIVSNIFSGVFSYISAIKTTTEIFVVGVDALDQFLADNVIVHVIDDLILGFQLFIKSFGYILCNSIIILLILRLPQIE